MSESILDLPGKAALSQFALDKLRVVLPAIVYAEFVHVLHLKAPLSEAELAKSLSLLSYGPNEDLPLRAGQRAVTVLPRHGTISPWSSKATNIFEISGLNKVSRVERGVRWFVNSDARLAADQLALIHDRMTEECHTVETFASVFAQAEPRPKATVELGSDFASGCDALEAANKGLGLALSQDEIEYLVHAYMRLDRAPTDIELMMFAQANSEHCRHKIFNAEWVIDGEPQPKSLFAMIRNTHAHINGANILSAYSDNAAVIEGHVDERLWVAPNDHVYDYVAEPIHILMKVETHNHPTAIAPFPGAATGSGGEIRDEGAVGRGSKPKAGLTGFSTSHLNLPELAEPWELDTGKPAHMASALQIMLDGPIGGASFNNEFGRPALGGYFRTFEMSLEEGVRGYHKPIMIAGGVGTVRSEHVRAKGLPPGTALVVLGGPAMLIGLGGGAASSMASGSSASELDFASVQRGNPEMERRCQEVIDQCCALGEANPIRLIHDVGAGGLSNALPELVSDGGAGGDFELRDVPSADSGMSPLEIWCNEAQERYVMGVDAEHLDTFRDLCARERCPFAVVGYASATKHLQVHDAHFSDTPVDLPLDVLLGKPPKMERAFTRQAVVRPAFDFEGIDLSEAVARVLRFPAVASKQFLITIGDRTITGQVAAQQMVGPWQVPVGDVAVTLRGYQSFRGEAFAMGERTPLALINSAAAARIAVAEALTNIVSADVESVERVVLSANWMAAAGSEIEDQGLYDAVRAVGEEFCPALGIAIPVGKDSLSMQTQWRDQDEDKSVVAPVSLIVSSFAPVCDVRLTATPQLQPQASELILLHCGEARMGGSVLGQVFNQLGDTAPDVDSPDQLRQLLDFVLAEKRRGTILAQHDRSDGGLLATLCEMAFAGRQGVDVSVPADVDLLPWLFNEEIGIVVQVDRHDSRQFCERAPVPATVVGVPRLDEQVTIQQGGRAVYTSQRAELQAAWAKVSHLMQRRRDNAACADEEYQTIQALRSQDIGLHAALTFDPDVDVCAPFINVGVQPKIAVLREQGVNGQIEMAAAFKAANFDCVDVHMSDLVNADQQLDQFQALVACGGFSYGDVLGGGGGWAKSILFNPRLADQFAAFFEAERLVLGICNGCQMLAQLKSLIPGAAHWPVFVRNRSEQFEARMVLTQIGNAATPWLDGMNGSVMPVAVAHGEGRPEFDAPDDVVKINRSQQVALRYVDSQHHVTEAYPANPNGAHEGLAGLTAAAGRVLIMMPHPERVYRTVQNVVQPGDWGEDGPWLRLFRNARVALD